MDEHVSPPSDTPSAFWSPLFGIVAPSLGWAPPLRYLLRRDRILRLVSNTEPSRLLEVGCGAGALLDDFARLGHDAAGLESSPNALARARALAHVSGQRQRIYSQPDRDWTHAFDIVCAFDVLEHIEDDGAAVDDWIGWLRPNGRLCLSVPAHQKRWGPGDEWAGHWRRYERDGLLELLRARGLVVEHFECYGFPLANVTESAARATYQRMIDARAGTYSKEQATAASGIERNEHIRLFRWMNTLPGRASIRLFMMMQALAARTDWGSGYLVLARRS